MQPQPPFELHPPVLLQPLDPELADELLELDDADEAEEVEDDVDDEDDTSPLDDAEVDTLPLDPPDADDVEEPPLEVDVEEPPVEVDDPPVEVDDPPVDDPPVDVDPPLLDDVEEMTIPPDPPLPPPKKPPAKKPPPKPPPPPPTAAAAPPPPPLTTGISLTGGGRGTGIPWVVTTTTGCAAVCVTVRRTIRLRTQTRLPPERTDTLPPTQAMGRRTLRRTTVRFFCTFCDMICSARAVSATCTAPPPISAPPQVQAQSFAKAIRTDMTSQSFVAYAQSAAKDDNASG